jgi:hypothetical protein
MLNFKITDRTFFIEENLSIIIHKIILSIFMLYTTLNDV